MKNKFISKQSSPIATGGGGMVFEISAQTIFAILMLSHGRVAGFPSHEIISLKQQTRVEGNNVDDFQLVLRHCQTSDISNVYCQAKRTISVSGNTSFKEVISAAYIDSCNQKFRRNRDILSLICGSISRDEQEAISFILNLAQAQESSKSFFLKATTDGFADKKVRAILVTLKKVITSCNGSADEEEIYQFLRCFRVWCVDLHYENGFVLALMHSLITLATKNTASPQAVWSLIYYELAEKNKLAGEISAESFSEEILNVFSPITYQSVLGSLSSDDAMSSIALAPNISADTLQDENGHLFRRIQSHRNVNDAFIAVLVGGWNDTSEKDKLFISHLTDAPYDEWKTRLKILHLEFPEIFSFKNNEWQVSKRKELLKFFDRYFYEDILKRFQTETVACLSEINPEFEFPSETRLYQGQRSENNYSIELRKNVSETLAILGNMLPSSNYSYDKLKWTAIATVEAVLSSNDYKTWGSLNRNIEYLAEAAPDNFLNAVERMFCIDTTPLQRLYAEEENDNFFHSRNYSNGIVWALEKLAWTDQYFMRTMSVLINLTKCDRNASWGNTPLNALIAILLPWHPQTLASISKRKNVILPLIADVPKSAWKLLLGLLPHKHSTTSGTVKPQFLLDVPEGFPKNVLIKEYWELTNHYLLQALTLAKNDVAKLCELVDFINDVSEEYQEKILLLVSSEDILNKTEEEKFPLWEKLLRLSKKHRQFPDAEWVLPENSIKRVEDTADLLKPKKSSLAYIPYFSYHAHDIIPHKASNEKSYREAEKLISQIQEEGTRKIFEEERIAGLIEFAAKSDIPHAVGVAVAKWFSPEQTEELLTHCLASDRGPIHSFISGFIVKKYEILGESWFKELKHNFWTSSQTALFLCAFPISTFILSLVNNWLKGKEYLYWEKVDVLTLWISTECFYTVIDGLLGVGRPWKAIDLLGQQQYSEELPFDANKARIALFTEGKVKEIPNQMTGYHLLNLLHSIQNTDQLTDDEKAIIEWNFIEVLHNGGNDDGKRSPKFLYKKLSSDPDFFCEILGYAYRSEKEKSTEQKTSEHQQQLAKRAWELLWYWHNVPGINDDGLLNYAAFISWFNRVVKKTIQSGHLKVALITIGGALFYSPAEADKSLWIDKKIATLLNKIEYEKLREGYSTECSNSRGVFWVDPTGAPELELAKQFEDKATAVDNLGYSRFASTLRSVAQNYRTLAKHHQENVNKN